MVSKSDSYGNTKVPGFGASVEQFLLFNNNSILLKNKLCTKTSVQNESKGSNWARFCWWEPTQNSLPVEFCKSSTILGLSFISKPKLHMSERIFWAVAFLFGVVAAVYLINEVWQRYYRNPVIVSFQADSVNIDTIPFPSVTLCNMNAFPKSKIKRIEEIAKEASPRANMAKEALKYVRSVCNAQQSFAQNFDFAFNRGVTDDAGLNDTISEDSQDEMIDFLLEHTLPCEDLIHLCSFGEQKVECKEIFKPVITDYGKCCTFNILPLPLLLKDPKAFATTNQNSGMEETNSALGKKKRWSTIELNEWRLWDYHEGFVLKNKTLRMPYRQKRAGLPYGLSILIDPNLNDWYCPISDSEGFRILLHTPLEMPHIDEFASVISLNKEALIEVHPELINADDDIVNIKRESRNCFFPKERTLNFFVPYTGGNCIDECTSIILGKRCNCTHFFMPRDDGMSICNSDPDSKDHQCISNAKVDLLHTLKMECDHCDSLCEDVQYNFELTMSTLQDPMILWNDPDPTEHTGPPQWANNKMTLLHVYFGSDTIVPKLRTRVYGTTDLIANTGGLLGLCLGFSALSAVEIIYFLTLRVFWQLCWKRLMRKRAVVKFMRSFKTKQANPSRERHINLDVNYIPVMQRQQNLVKYPKPSPMTMQNVEKSPRRHHYNYGNRVHFDNKYV